jgi:hypothetical protein
MTDSRLRMLAHQGCLVEVTHALSSSCFESADLDRQRRMEQRLKDMVTTDTIARVHELSCSKTNSPCVRG